jgi:hypothetical protein
MMNDHLRIIITIKVATSAVLTNKVCTYQKFILLNVALG